MYQRFQDFSETNGIDEAIRAMVLEEYTTDEIVKHLKYDRKNDAMDLVSESRRPHDPGVHESPKRNSRLKGDYKAAKAAAMNVSAVRFLSKDKIQEVH